jgi:hypothetical protein
MAVEHHEHYDDHVHDAAPVVDRRVAAVREPFTIVQVLMLAIGIFFIVLGAVGLERAGLHHIDRPRAVVGPFTMTPLLALIHLAIGVIALTGATSPAASRGTAMFLAPILIAGGIVALIQGVRALGWNRADGFVYIITGAVALIGAIVTRTLATYSERRVVA